MPSRRQRAKKATGKRGAAAAAPAERETAIVLYRACRPGWAVETQRQPGAPSTRFVCPFCPRSHRVPGPVRGFRRVQRQRWARLRRLLE